MIRAVAFLALIGLSTSGAIAVGPGTDGEAMSLPVLRHNPFERAVSLERSPSELPASGAVASPPWSGLRATVVAGPRSMVNVDGQIVLVGEKFDGFLLVEVGERVAVFERNGKRRVLTME